MKKLFYFFAIAALALTMASCNENNPEQGKGISVKILSESDTVPLTGGQIVCEVKLSKEYKSWKAYAGEDWAVVSPSSETEDATVTITIAKGLKTSQAIYFIPYKTENQTVNVPIAEQVILWVHRGYKGDTEVDPGTLVECKYQYKEFSVSPTKKVIFSKGNLQYQGTYNGALGVFRFAEHQYDYVGGKDSRYGNVYVNAIEKCDNAQIDAKYTGWIDLFGWGTSGYKNQWPYSITSNDSFYGPAEGDITGTHYDWGIHCAISSTYTNQWRTLTIEEWQYLLGSDRADHYAFGIVDNKEGLILLPDNYIAPEGCDLITGNGLPKRNKITLANWGLMEEQGAVFLPTAGQRILSTEDKVVVRNMESSGFYWSTTTSTVGHAHAVMITSANGAVSLISTFPKSCGLSVRLVKDK